MTWRVEHADALTFLRKLEDNSVDSLVTDPPAGIGFASRNWDKNKGGRIKWIAWLAEIMAECNRVLKPGAHGFVWALPRTSHWTGMAIEDSGLQIRDCLHHVFGSGMPKSKKLTDAGEVGNGLKPGHEDWWLVRKPFKGSLTKNYAAHGTGGLNIDACRVKHASPEDIAKHAAGVAAIKARGGSMDGSWKNSSNLSGASDVTADGRWPANVILTHSASCVCVGTKEIKANPTWDTPNRECVSQFTGAIVSDVAHGEDGTESIAQWECADDCPVRAMEAQRAESSRYFLQLPFVYQAKPGKKEKSAGLELFRAVTGGKATGRKEGSAGTRNPRAGAGRTGGARNVHPTTKSVPLMRYLCRLVTPPGGTVFDPFTGSGTTGVAALLEGFSFLGCEMNDTDEEPFVSIARARLTHVEGGIYMPRESLRAASASKQGSLL